MSIRNSQKNQNIIARPGFIKRILLVIYDGFLLGGLVVSAWLLCGVILMFLLDQSISDYSNIKFLAFCFLLLIALGLSLFFYSWFWTRGGQTLGMRAWNLYLVDQNGKYINRKTAMLRFGVALLSWACFGLGFAWILLNRKNLTWHDIATKTQIVYYKNK